MHGGPSKVAMDRFSSLKAFVAVVDNNGFAAAARRLQLSRSQVSKLVMALEDDLQVQLLNRTTKKVSPTPAGQAFYERATRILDDLEEAERALQDDQEEPQGELRINAPMSFGTLHLGPAIADFMERYPKVRVQLNLTDRFVDTVAEGYDMTLRIAESAETMSMIDHEIVEAKRVICASPDFMKRHGEPETPKDLEDLPCLHYGNLPTGAAWRLNGPNGQIDARVNAVLTSNNGEVLRDAARKGLGLALLPTFIVGEALQAGRLITVLTEYTAPKISICLLYPPNRHLAPRIRLFVEFMYERFGERPYWD